MNIKKSHFWLLFVVGAFCVTSVLLAIAGHANYKWKLDQAVLHAVAFCSERQSSTCELQQIDRHFGGTDFWLADKIGNKIMIGTDLMYPNFDLVFNADQQEYTMLVFEK